MQPIFRMKQLAVALAAAGFGLAVGAGYNHLDAPAVALADAASPPAASRIIRDSRMKLQLVYRHSVVGFARRRALAGLKAHHKTRGSI